MNRAAIDLPQLIVPRIEHCELDSTILSFRVARIATRNASSDQINAIVGRLKTQGYKLVYWLSYGPHSEDIRAALKYDPELYAANSCFAQTITDAVSRFNTSIIDESAAEISEHELKNLVVACTQYSHLRKDPRIHNSHVYSLFNHWLQDGIYNRNNRSVALVRNGHEALGFSVYTINQNKLHINLFAVSENLHKRGFGSQLISFLVDKARKHNCSHVTVTAQRDNNAAVDFYESSGFAERYRYSIYHFWI